MLIFKDFDITRHIMALKNRQVKYPSVASVTAPAVIRILNERTENRYGLLLLLKRFSVLFLFSKVWWFQWNCFLSFQKWIVWREYLFRDKLTGIESLASMLLPNLLTNAYLFEILPPSFHRVTPSLMPPSDDEVKLNVHFFPFQFYQQYRNFHPYEIIS